ncbi:MAG: membrane protein insertion efficiency factor YidD [Candidatus Margulisiibacteriota bacterium]
MWDIVKFLLFLYRKFKHSFFGATCRFYPSCSYYFEEAVEVHGLFYGIFLAFKRLIRCNRWAAGGYDPVPTKGSRV